MLLIATPGQLHPFSAELDTAQQQQQQQPMFVGFETFASSLTSSANANADQSVVAKLQSLFVDAKNGMVCYY